MDKKAKTIEQKYAILDTVGVSRIVQKNKLKAKDGQYADYCCGKL